MELWNDCFFSCTSNRLFLKESEKVQIATYALPKKSKRLEYVDNEKNLVEKETQNINF